MLDNPSMLDGKETDLFLFHRSSCRYSAISVSVALCFSFLLFLFNAFSNINYFLY